MKDIPDGLGARRGLEYLKVFDVVKVCAVAHYEGDFDADCKEIEKYVYHVFVDFLLGKYVDAIIRGLIVIY